METVKVQDISANDLPWKIEYHAERCTMCGSCVASCTFRAIKVEIQRKSVTFSQSDRPEPVHQQIALPVIKQIAEINHACRGCGMCERVCPNNAIKAVRNPDNRRNLLFNRPIKRGGRTNLNAQRTLDQIIVGRISQMTDPSLDSIRHTFDIRSPLGRILSPKELPFEISGGKLVSSKKIPPVRWILNEKCNLPVRMSSGEGGMPVPLMESDYLKYFIIQIASGHFGWNRIIKTMPKMRVDPAGILIKIGQGAKPGDGGLLQAEKVAPNVQAICGVGNFSLGLQQFTARSVQNLRRVLH